MTPGLLPRLTALRVLAAVAVVFFHLDAWHVASLPAGLSSVGYIGVSFFFVLSGVVLAWGTRPGLPARTFYRRRFARVWPSHAVVLGIAAVVPVVQVARGWDVALPNLLLVQAWWRDPEVVYGMNGVSWSLSCEAFFYAAFPLTVLVLRRVPAWARWGAAVLGLVFALVAYQVTSWSGTLPVVRFAEFLLGVVAGLALRDGWRPRVPAPAAWAALAAGLAGCLLAPPSVADPLVGAVFLVVVLAAADRDLAGRTGWLTSRPLVFAGEASFALYLVHELVIVNLRAHLHGPAWAQAAALLAVAAAAAVALHLAVERPVNRLLRGGSASVALAPPAAAAPDHPRG
ncbi:acyltransferase family protein [Geodermatophilus sp. SYSU D00815]